MEPVLIIIGVAIFIGAIIFISKRWENKRLMLLAPRKIQFDQLETVIEELINKNLEYNFFGIASKGIDCIYFVDDNGKINIEFEAMVNEQIEYIDKVKEFGKSNGYQVSMITYGNKPDYDDMKEAPVVKIESGLDISSATEFGKQIMREIFNCDETTIFEIVP